MSHSVEFHPEPVAAFSTSDALVAQLGIGGPLREDLQWENAGVLVSEIGPKLHILIAHVPGIYGVPETLARVSLWECSYTGYDEVTRRVWMSSGSTRRFVLEMRDDHEFWKLVRLVFDARDRARVRLDDLERMRIESLSLIVREDNF